MLWSVEQRRPFCFRSQRWTTSRSCTVLCAVQKDTSPVVWVTTYADQHGVPCTSSHSDYMQSHCEYRLQPTAVMLLRMLRKWRLSLLWSLACANDWRKTSMARTISNYVANGQWTLHLLYATLKDSSCVVIDFIAVSATLALSQRAIRGLATCTLNIQWMTIYYAQHSRSAFKTECGDFGAVLFWSPFFQPPKSVSKKWTSSTIMAGANPKPYKNEEPVNSFCASMTTAL